MSKRLMIDWMSLLYPLRSKLYVVITTKCANFKTVRLPAENASVSVLSGDALKNHPNRRSFRLNRRTCAGLYNITIEYNVKQCYNC